MAKQFLLHAYAILHFLGLIETDFIIIRYEYLRTTATELNDGGRHLMMKQRGFQLINPTEKWFPGLMEIRDSFSTWTWCYGKTPKFTVQKDLQLKSDEKDHNVQLNVIVNAVSKIELLNAFFWLMLDIV